ncbi:MAG: DMT family transporter [Hyphomicrobiaceae bacterium]|nr:DMT family transporter [Hyphomicrobiaceae bacterium]
MTPTAHSSDSMKGVLAMMVATLLLTLNDAVTKLLTEDYSFWQVLALRQLVSLGVVVLYIHWYTGWDAMKITNRTGVALRAVFFVATTVFIVASFSMLPLAFVTAIAFSSPVFVVAFSHFFTSESVGPRRWLAVLVGFVGVLTIVRPGGADFSYVLVLPVLAALTAGIRDVITRGLSRTESSISILFWSNVAVITLALIVTTMIGWQAITPVAALLLLLNGLLNASAHFLIIDALRLGDASLVSPFRYSGLLWAIMLGLVIWGDFPDAWTLLGATLLIASGIYIIERAPRAAKQGTDQ